MRTPGRCTNTEGCWISASHRNVWLTVGEDFACPNCGGLLSPPLPEARSFRATKRFAALGVVASVGIVAMGAGVAKLSTVHWAGQSVAARTVQAPMVADGQPENARYAAHEDVADAADAPDVMTAANESRAARDVARSRANMPFAFEGVSTYTDGQPNGRPALGRSQAGGATKLARGGPGRAAGAAGNGPEVIFSSVNEGSIGDGQSGSAETPHVDAAVIELHPAVVTLLAQTALASGQMLERPVQLPISYGRPLAPETDAEPYSASWHHHAVVTARQTGFLPAPAAAETRPASADAIAQICRIPSLLH